MDGMGLVQNLKKSTTLPRPRRAVCVCVCVRGACVEEKVAVGRGPDLLHRGARWQELWRSMHTKLTAIANQLISVSHIKIHNKTYHKLAAIMSEDHIKVVCRIRPANTRESSSSGQVRKCVSIPEYSNNVVLSAKPENKSFTFDFAADDAISQEV
jgi:hypothetical protein